MVAKVLAVMMFEFKPVSSSLKSSYLLKKKSCHNLPSICKSISDLCATPYLSPTILGLFSLKLREATELVKNSAPV